MQKLRRINFNQHAPDLELQDAGGSALRLSGLWAERPLLLAFTRHFGCTQCKEMLEQLVEAREQIEAAGLEIAVVTQGAPEEARAFGERYAPGLRVLSDPARKAYRAYGLERGSIFQTLVNYRVWLAVSRASKKGYRVELPPEGQDAMQMSGIFIINREGRVVLPYYYDHIADHPPLDLLLNGVLSTRWDHRFDGRIGPDSQPTSLA